MGLELISDVRAAADIRQRLGRLEIAEARLKNKAAEVLYDVRPLDQQLFVQLWNKLGIVQARIGELRWVMNNT